MGPHSWEKNRQETFEKSQAWPQILASAHSLSSSHPDFKQISECCSGIIPFTSALPFCPEPKALSPESPGSCGKALCSKCIFLKSGRRGGLWPGLRASSRGPPQSPKFQARGINRSLLECPPLYGSHPLYLVRGRGRTEEPSRCQDFPL